MMYVYIVTCLVNGKYYIGQTARTIEERFQEHVYNAFHRNQKFHFMNAIRKYGPENFKVSILRECDNKEDLNFYEKYFIEQYDACNPKYGYNMTPGGEGGNTYVDKSEEELLSIKSKIGRANMGGKNGNAHPFKMKRLSDQQVFEFGSCSECAQFFNDLGLKTTRPGLKNLREAKEFGIQTVFMNNYIFSETNEFSDYSFEKRKSGTIKYRVFKDNKFIGFFFSQEEMLRKLNLRKLSDTKKYGYTLEYKERRRNKK